MSRLFLGSYDGTVNTIHFDREKPPKESIQVIASTKAASPNPSWITIDATRGVIYCNSNDSATMRGCLKSFSIQPDGSLRELCSIGAPVGAAYHTLYGSQKFLAIPYYYSGSVGVYDVGTPAKIEQLQMETFTNFIPGPGRAQEQPRPHQTVVDPTGNFLLVPDLGADIIRVFAISQRPDSPHPIHEVQGLSLPRPSFPRHVAFAVLAGKTFMYILNQDICTLVTYTVEYTADGRMNFRQADEQVDLMQRGDRVVQRPRIEPPEHGTTASHLAVSPDQRFLLLSVRKDQAFEIKSPLDPDVMIKSDSILSFHIDQTTGAPKFAHEAHAGGYIPRQFSLNATGDLIAIVQQANGWLSIYERDVDTGDIGRLVGVKSGFGENGPACVKWLLEDRPWC